jgi:hypothetical protein
VITRRIRGILLSALIASLAAGASLGADRSKPHIDGLSAAWDDARVLVSFRVADALDDETLERLHSGIPVSYRHRVELLARRSWPLIPAKVLARATVHTTAEYDSLTKRYALSRTVELKASKKKQRPEAQLDRHETASLEEMEVWMTAFEDLPVLDPSGELARQMLKVRVQSALGRHYVLLIFPARIDVSAELKLEP